MWCTGCQRGQKPNESGFCPECLTRIVEPETLKVDEKERIVKAIEEEPKPVIKEPVIIKKEEPVAKKKNEDKPQKAKRKMSEETKAKIREALKAKKDSQEPKQ